MKYYITLGQLHMHIINNIVIDKDCVAEIEADNMEKAREIAVKYFGYKFCTVLDESDINEKFMGFFPRGIIKI